jgi:hypothetical protein
MQDDPRCQAMFGITIAIRICRSLVIISEAFYFIAVCFKNQKIMSMDMYAIWRIEIKLGA